MSNKEYQRGYRAGRKKTQPLSDAEFFDAALLIALPVCIEVKNWESGGVPITKLDERTKLAGSFALAAVEQRKRIKR